MTELDINIRTDEEKKDLVMRSEKEYKDGIIETVKRIAADKPRFLMISGPTCSGKTTTAHIVSREFKKLGISARIISIDDFFHSRDYVNEHNVNIESLDAVDMAYFSECVNKISCSEEAMLPIFDFIGGERVGYVPYKPKDEDIIMFEGIQALYPEVLAVFPKDLVKTLYLGFLDDVKAGKYVFKAKELRFYRRVVRDTKYRGTDVDTVIHQWDNVIDNEDENILPYAKNTDYFINTFLRYELFVLKTFLFDKMSYRTEMDMAFCGQMKRKCKDLPEIPPEFVPEDSMLREFIGT